jgi:hypothetical protein
LIQEILKRNWIPSLLVWLSAEHELHLQIGALWALTNIAAGKKKLADSCGDLIGP